MLLIITTRFFFLHILTLMTIICNKTHNARHQMTYSETYRQLKATYPDMDNFEIVAEAFDKHLRDVF